MDQAEIMDVAYDAVWTLLKVTTPLMLIALGVGLIITLFQALTQIKAKISRARAGTVRAPMPGIKAKAAPTRANAIRTT